MNYISKETSYDLAHEIAQKAKKVLGLSQYDVETLEHDINNLRAHEWLDLFDMIPDNNEVKKLYFTHCVELNNDNEQELEENMEDFNIYLILTDYSVEQYGYYNANDFYDYLNELKKKTDDELFDDEILAYVGMNSNEEVIEYYISNKADIDKVRNIVDNGFEIENLDEGYQLKENHDINNLRANDQELKESMEDKTYAVTVKYHNEPNAKIEARSAKDRKDLEYQLNMDDEVEWYDFDEEQFNEGLFDKKPAEVKIGVFAKSGKAMEKVLLEFDPKSNESTQKIFVNALKRLDPNKFEVLEYTVDKKGVVQKGKVVSEYNKLLGTQAKEDQEKRNAELKKQPHWTIDPKTGAKKYRQLVDAEDIADAQFNEGYSKEGYSWDEINGMIHIYEDGKLIDKYPDMESAEEAGWDLDMLNESLDQMREKALKMKEDSNAFAILYGYRTKDGKEVELEPEEFATEEEYKERIQQITDSLTKLSDKDPRGNRYGYERNITFYTVYPNNNNGNKEKITEGELFDKIKAKYPTLDDSWNMGSDKTMLTNREFELLYNLADKLSKNSPNQYKYEVKLTYEDYDAGMQWYNIICYDKKGNSWQVLNTKEWLDLMNTKDVDSIYDRVISGEYFQDKQKDIKDMNMGELFNHMED